MVHTSVKWFETALLAISAFNLFMVCSLMLWKIRRIQPASVLLLVWLFISGIAMVMMYLIDTGLIIAVPWLFLAPSPLYYLLFPSGYLYIRMMVKDEVRLSRVDLMHIVPAVLHLIELVPYFLKPAGYKLQAAMAAVEQPLGFLAHSEGVLPDYQHNVIRGLLGLIYSGFIFKLFHKRHDGQRSQDLSVQPIYPWLVGFAIMQLLMAILLVGVLGVPQLAPPDIRATILYMTMAATQAGAAVVLLFKPDLMYGLPVYGRGEYGVSAGSTGKSNNKHSTQVQHAVHQYESITEDRLESDNEWALIRRIDAFMDGERPYLKPRYHTADLSADLNVPSHHISYALNRRLKLKYADYINDKRIAHMKKLADEGLLNNYTLEALALKSGFNSRITFIRAVQKLRGVNPSDYFKAGD